MTASTIRTIPSTEVAKIVRKTLRESFPGVKFSVRTSKYAGGSSIDVRWTDGPTESRVDGAIGHLHGASFDGMTDMKSFHTTEINTDDFEYEEVSLSNDYIFTSRTYSDEATAAMVQHLAALNPSKSFDAHFPEQMIDRDEVFQVKKTDDPEDSDSMSSSFINGAFNGHDVIRAALDVAEL